MSLVRRLSLTTGTALVALLSGSCSVIANADNAAGTAGCYGPSCDGGASSDHYSQVVVGSDGGMSDADAGWDPLCGTGCSPDEESMACRNTTAPDDAGADADDAEGGLADGGPDAASATLGCFVKTTGSGSPVAACQLAGSGAAGDPCVAASDCAPGYACVGKPGSQTGGQCRRYCCAGADRCPSGTFCTGRDLFDPTAPTGAAVHTVPVCVTADNCRLSEAYGCDGSINSDCKCTDNTACTVVRADGTTSCLVPGTGVTGQECACATGGVCTCAPGYVCSYGTHTCQMLCSTQADDQACGSGICQSSPFLPAGFGICTLNVDAGH
jgi:hypothetical protein